MPPRLAKLTAPLATPENNQSRKSTEIINNRKRKHDEEEDDTYIPPVRLRKTTQGWQIHTDDDEMDVSCITLYNVDSEILY